MREVILKLKEAIEINAIIEKQGELWQKIFEALEAYLKGGQLETAPSNSFNKKNEYLTTKEAAEYLGLKYGTLAGWRFYDTGPKYIKMGRSVRYKVKDLDDFASKKMPIPSPL